MSSSQSSVGMWLVLLLVVTSAGCGGNGTPSDDGGHGSGGGQLYVADETSNTILRFGHALTAAGEVGPAGIIPVGAPRGLLIDIASDNLYVASRVGAILVFNSASTAFGSTAPTRRISGQATMLTQPVDLTLDKARDELYVASGTTILVFKPASTVTGNVAPSRVISLGSGGYAIVIDAASDRLFVADALGNAIHIFDNASQLSGAAIPSRTLTGSATLLQNPCALGIDASGRLLVSSAGIPPRILFYNDTATLNGNIAPSAALSGTLTGLGTPRYIAVNKTGGGELYIANNGGGSWVPGNVLIFANLATANGNLAPTRTIIGPATGFAFDTTVGVALDPTR